MRFRHVLALVASLSLGSCAWEPLLPVGQPVDEVVDEVDELDEVDDIDDPEENAAIIRTDLFNDRVRLDLPPITRCYDVEHLLDAGYLYEAAALPSGEVAIASGSGTWIFDPTTRDARIVHGSHAWDVAVDDEGRLFSLTIENAIVAFDVAAVPVEIVEGEANIVDIGARDGRVFFTEEVPGRLRSVTFRGEDPQELMGAEIAHELLVDAASGTTYVAGWFASGTIARVDASGNSAAFFDSYTNAREGGVVVGNTYFSSAMALAQNETHVFFSTSISPGGLARVNKETGEWAVVDGLPESFAMELFAHDGWLYFSESDVAVDETGSFVGRLRRIPVDAQPSMDAETVLDCGPSVRILGAADGFLYLAMDANGSAPFLTRVALD